MLYEWYRNGIAQAYIIFRENYIKSQQPFINKETPQIEFEKLLKNQIEFEKFLDKNKEKPWENIKYKPEKKDYYTYKPWLNTLTSSKQKISANKNIWQIVNFGIKNPRTMCIICSRKGTKENIILTFPFERQIKNFFPSLQVKGRLQLCPLCQKICFYSFGNIFYNQSDDRITIFFPVSDDYVKVAELSILLQELRIPKIDRRNQFSNIYPKGLATYYPFEYLYPTLFMLYHRYRDKEKEIFSLIQEINIQLISFILGNLAIFDFSEFLTRLDRLFKIFVVFDKKVGYLNKELQKKDREPLDKTLIFNDFLNDLVLDGKKLADKNRLREEWVKTLVRYYKVDYITLNNIVMKNISSRKRQYKFIRFYDLVIKSILEGVNMEKEIEFFEHLNNLGYALGKDMENKGYESILWDIFRTRTSEDFIETLVQVQLKLRTSLDLRKIEANKARWREVKAIILNGMANALFSSKQKEVKL